MAEQVQSILDQMVPSLRDFLDKGIFSESEVRAVVKRRRESEYLLQRRVARKADFLRYIEAEKSLERLRELRTQQIYRRRRQNVANGNDNDKRLANTSIVQHIHFLFQRAIRKFRSDVTIFIQHAEFAKQSKSNKMLGKIYAEALQIHPRHVGLWIEAASFEFFGDHGSTADDDDEQKGDGIGGGSILSARVLLQRGLRINPQSQDLWLQAFALELHYIQKLRGRKEILQLNVQTKKDTDGSEKSFVSNENFKTLMQVPLLIYKNAVKNVPNDVTFRLKFMDLCKMFPETDSLEAFIISTIENDFGDTPKAWISRAMYALENTSNGKNPTTLKGSKTGFLAAPISTSESDDDSESSDNNGSSDEENVKPSVKKRKREDKEAPTALVSAIQIIEDATNNVKTPEMFIESVDFVCFLISKSSALNKEGNLEPGELSNKPNYVLYLDHLFTKASNAGIISPELILKHADFLLHTGDPKKSYQLLESSSRDEISCKKDVRIWLKLSEIASRIHLAYPDKTERKQCVGPRQILRKGLENFTLEEYGHLIILQKIFFHMLSNSSSTQNTKAAAQLYTNFQKILMLSHRLERFDISEEMHNDNIVIPISSVSLSYFQHAMKENDMQLIRKIFKTIINSNVGKLSKKSSLLDLNEFRVFFDSYICAEESTTEKGSQMSLRRVYEEIIRFFANSG